MEHKFGGKRATRVQCEAFEAGRKHGAVARFSAKVVARSVDSVAVIQHYHEIATALSER